MKNIIVERAKAVWKDRVMSKVISAALISIALWLWNVFSSASFSKAVNLATSPITIPA